MDYPLDSSIPGPVRPVLPTASQQFRMVLALLSRLPLIILTALRHLLGHSAPSHYLSMRAELAVAVIRTFIRHTPPQTLSEAQRDSLLDLGIPPRIWVSTYSWSGPPERSICDALIDGIRNLRISNDQLNFRLPKLARCEADWIGYRTMTDPKEPMPELSQQERFQAMMKECTKPTTILYLHGGSFYLGDPATIRPIAKKLAKITGGRCFAVRYRLAPQNPFPAALLDTLVAYFSLLYPPPDAYHEPVHPEHLVIAGDSAGGNLALALVQLVLEFRRKGNQILWYGEPRDVPLPAGISCSSPWLDITHSAPTFDTAAPFDILPDLLEMHSNANPCAIWPAKPPRISTYVEDHLLTHPLVSPILSKSWECMPPIFLFIGWERLAYENKFLAKKLAATEGVKIVFQEYEALPHSFNLLIPHPNTRRSFNEWAGFIRSVVEDPGSIISSACRIKSRTGQKETLQFEELSDETNESILETINAHAQERVRKKGSRL